MGTDVGPAKRDDIPEIIKLMQGVGIGLNGDQFCNYFFDVPAAESSSPMRGGVIVRENHEVVGYCGLSPCRIFYRGNPYDGYQMGILGVKNGHGGDMFALMDYIVGALEGSFVYANTANAKSVALWTGYAGFQSGPSGGETIRFGVFPLALFALPRVTRDGNSAHDFTDPRFEHFWQAYLASSPGPFTSREPARLQRIFGVGLAAGTRVLLTYQENDAIKGYAVMRVRHLRHTPYLRFDILDIAALGHSPVVLEQLLKKCCGYARRHGGVLLEYIGAVAHMDDILARYIPRGRPALANTAFWFTGNPELSEAFKDNTGWFFGPYDGDRCM